MSAARPFVEARDFLFKHRTDYLVATRDFRWPVLKEFNWALDYFDAMAKGNDQPALWLVGEDGSEHKRSFAEMSARSNRVANWLRSIGVKRGDPILMMLGNELALWETMLGAIKLGAVLIPATTLLTPDDLLDRFERGNVRHVVVGFANVEKFATLAGSYTRIAVGGAAPGWHSFADAAAHPASFTPDGPTRADDPLLLYFTSGTTSKPKLVLHTQQSYPVGHLSTMFWIGLQPGDVHLNISSPGWAKHAWSCFFAPWNAGACIFIYNYTRFNAKALLGVLERCGVTTLCAPPTVWRMLIQEDLASYRGRLKIRELLGAGEPLNPEVIGQVKTAWGITLRDAEGKEANEGEVCLALDPRPLGLMVGYMDSAEKTAEATRDGYYRTGDVASRDADGYITYVGRADDVFKASDYRISPFELESALIEHPAVAEAAVVPSPDPLRLAVPKAFIILTQGTKPSRELAKEIFLFLRGKLAPYKRVRRLEFSDLPKTISGKIRRVQLRAIEAERRGKGERAEWEFFEEDFPELRQ